MSDTLEPVEKAVIVEVLTELVAPKKLYRPPQVQTQRILMPNFFSTGGTCPPDCP